MTGEQHHGPDLHQLLRVAMRRKMLLLVPWAIALVLGIAAAVLLPPVYFSSVTLLLERPQALSGSLSNMVNPFNPDRQADIMRDEVQSTVFLRGVVSSTGLSSDPETRAWALRYANHYVGNNAEEKVEAFLIDRLRQAITIRRAKSGNTFQVQVEDRLPQRAQRFAQSVSDQFVTASKAAQLEAVRATQEFSTEQQQVYKRRLEESEGRLEALKRNAVSSSLAGSAVSEGSLPRARSLLEQAELDASEQKNQVDALRGQIRSRMSDLDPGRLSSSETNGMVAQLKGLERQIAASMLLTDVNGDNGMTARAASARKVSELEQQFTQNAAEAFPNVSPEVRDVLVRYRLAEADLQAKEARRVYLATAVGGFEQHAVMAPDADAQINKVQQEVETNRAFYNSFLQQSAAAQITEAFENARVSGHFTVLEPANFPQSPGKPNRIMLILLAFVLGGGVGIGAVLVVERHDQSVKNAEEIEIQLGLPVLGAIPRVEELERRGRRGRSRTVSPVPERDPGLLHRLKTESPLGLEFRRIYLKLAKTRGRSLPPTLLMTSSTRGEGKTTTSACLGITLARELDHKVLLVDFDLRSPALHRALGIPSSTWGLAQMLAQRKFDERFIRSTVLPNLHFLGTGRSEKPASELVDSDSVEWFINEARSRYGQVLLDSPPTLAVPDPLILGRVVDGVIYVIKAGQTIRKAAEYGVKVQREARDNLVGILMNNAGEILPHYYGYHDAYGYASEAAGGET